ncbi:patatin family protein [Tieghemostelium lacteum]|uniref:Patatin family protein n=1 Tax=Tieghemostelium lacteum TaxID=361077 RepID=A0A151ZBQ6_TIELA|nr:patatin family protein [Tieghemostelium lacteum]|eukprot:KYQ91383.1 patatin family protein [Tieghemostelium lacteum]
MNINSILSNLEHCGHYDKDNGPIYKFCNKCGIVCEDCNNKYHVHNKNKMFLKHPVEKLEDHLKSIFICSFLEFEKNNKLLPNQLTEMEENSKLLSVSWEEKKISTDNKWFNTGLNEDDVFLMVSFIGPTGTGKSTLISPLSYMTGEYPIPGNQGSTVSTSSDISSYTGTLQIEGKNINYLITDSEGIGGSVIPLKHPITNQKLEKNELEEFGRNREIFVKISYPRLLYMFSDVVVYTFVGVNQKGTITEQLKEISKISASSTNKTTKPHLIIVFNLVAKAGLKEVSESTKDFMDDSFGNKPSELNDFYKSITVVYIPNAKDNDITKKQFSDVLITSLYPIINEKLSESYSDKMNLKTRIPITRERVMSMMYLAIGKFNDNPNVLLDMHKLQAEMEENDKQIETIVGYLTGYFKAYHNHYSSSVTPKFTLAQVYEKSLDKLKSRILEVFLRHHKRTNTQISKHTKELFSDHLKQVSEEIDKYIPCSCKHQPTTDKTIGCVNFKDSHQKHQSSETYPLKKKLNGFLGLFGITETIEQNYDWFGDYMPEFESSNLVEYFNSITKDVKEISFKEPENIEYKGIKTDKICFGCLLGVPESTCTPCGHQLCNHCIKEGLNKCKICQCIQNLADGTLIDFTPTLGYRVLSLDGGGIRGIIECYILKELSKQLFGLPVNKFFDLIVGTSTGGLVALALTTTNITVDELTEKFCTKGKDIFKKTSFFSRFSGVLFQNFKYTQFQRTPKKEVFTEILGSGKPLHLSPKVAVTSVCNSDGSNKACLFASYRGKDPNINTIHDSTTVDAAEGTSAAPTYFPPFIFQGKEYLDGGIHNNNPCKVAYNQALTLWPNQKLDIIASLGTGHYTNNKHKRSENLKNFASMVINILTECESTWTDLSPSLNTQNSIRLTPLLDEDIDLAAVDDASVTKLVTASEKYIKSEQAQNGIKFLGNRLISTLFYVDKLKELNNKLHGKIYCRLKPESLDEASKNLFQTKIIDKIDLNTFQHPGINYTTNQLPIEFTIDLTNLKSPFIIDIKCALQSDNKTENNTSISGCPFELSHYLPN